MANTKTIRYITQDELKRLLIVITSRCDKGLYPIVHRHGLCASEVGGMFRLKEVYLDRRGIRINQAKRFQGGENLTQGDEVKALKAWFRGRKDSNTWLFPRQQSLSLSRHTLEYSVKYYGQRADSPAYKRLFHVLRHSIAIHLLEARADIRFVRDWLRHNNIQNTVIYSQITNLAREEQARGLFASPMIVGT
jgi:site-specific recombinase XerC